MKISFAPFVLKRRHTRMQNAGGFTLVEMALTLAILGLFVGSVISGVKVHDDGEAMRLTKERQRRVAVALSDFALKYGRLPCAANPANGPDSFGLADSCAMNSDHMGPVPFRTLGLSMQDAYDGYGNLMTYQVFEGALQDAAPSTFQIHSRCRFAEVMYNDTSAASRPNSRLQEYVPPWMVWISIDPMGADTTATTGNKNPAKAGFCCKRVTDHQKIFRNAVNNSVRAGDPVGYSSDANYWGALNTPVYYPSDSYPLNAHLGQRITYDAYMLTSHGKNGAGAYIYEGGGSFSRVPSPPTAVASAFDTATTAPNNRVLRPYNLNPGPDYYDNIVLWRTQETTISETGQTQCGSP